MSVDSHDELVIVETYWAQLREADEQLLRRARAQAHRRRLGRTLAIAVLALLLVAAAALAARTLLFGDAAPRSYPLQQRLYDSLKPGEARLAAVRAADPDGGPPWGIRVLQTSRGDLVCAQVGRVASGRLVAIGVAGAFNDDGRAHPLPVETEGCSRGRRIRRTSGPSAVLIAPSATRGGFLSHVLGGTSGCLPPDEYRAVIDGPSNDRRYIRRARARGDAAAVAEGLRALASAKRRLRDHPKACAPTDLRTVVAGLAGTKAVAATLTSGGVVRRVATKPADNGAFLFVSRGRQLDVGTLAIEYPNGMSCLLWEGKRPAATESSACRRATAGTP